MKITINGLEIPIADRYEVVLDADGDGVMGPVFVRTIGSVEIGDGIGSSITIDGTNGCLVLPGVTGLSVVPIGGT